MQSIEENNLRKYDQNQNSDLVIDGSANELSSTIIHILNANPDEKKMKTEASETISTIIHIIEKSNSQQENDVSNHLYEMPNNCEIDISYFDQSLQPSNNFDHNIDGGQSDCFNVQDKVGKCISSFNDNTHRNSGETNDTKELTNFQLENDASNHLHEMPNNCLNDMAYVYQSLRALNNLDDIIDVDQSDGFNKKDKSGEYISTFTNITKKIGGETNDNTELTNFQLENDPSSHLHEMPNNCQNEILYVCQSLQPSNDFDHNIDGGQGDCINVQDKTGKSISTFNISSEFISTCNNITDKSSSELISTCDDVTDKSSSEFISTCNDVTDKSSSECISCNNITDKSSSEFISTCNIITDNGGSEFFSTCNITKQINNEFISTLNITKKSRGEFISTCNDITDKSGSEAKGTVEPKNHGLIGVEVPPKQDDRQIEGHGFLVSYNDGSKDDGSPTKKYDCSKDDEHSDNQDIRTVGKTDSENYDNRLNSSDQTGSRNQSAACIKYLVITNIVVFSFLQCSIGSPSAFILIISALLNIMLNEVFD